LSNNGKEGGRTKKLLRELDFCHSFSFMVYLMWIGVFPLTVITTDLLAVGTKLDSKVARH